MIAGYYLIVFGCSVLGLRLIVSAMDRERIREEVQDFGGLLAVSRRIWRSGFFGFLLGRQYDLIYFDNKGRRHWAVCAVGMLSNAWLEDQLFQEQGGEVAPSNTGSLSTLEAKALIDKAKALRENALQKLSKLPQRGKV